MCDRGQSSKQDSVDTLDWALVCRNLRDLEDNLDPAAVDCTETAAVGENRRAVVEDESVEWLAAEVDTELVAVAVRVHCSVFEFDDNHLYLEEDSHCSAADLVATISGRLQMRSAKPWKAVGSLRSWSAISPQASERTEWSLSEICQGEVLLQRYSRRQHLFDKMTRDRNYWVEKSAPAEPHNPPCRLSQIL